LIHLFYSFGGGVVEEEEEEEFEWILSKIGRIESGVQTKS
jgi:hypothetical protein